MELVADYVMARIFRITADSYLTLVDATKGMHTADEPKSVALALLTDRLEDWHAYLATKGLKPRSPLVVRPGRPHDGFVIEDPEGYLLEFERFNPHPENENLIPLLKGAATIRAPGSALPPGLGFLFAPFPARLRGQRPKPASVRQIQLFADESDPPGIAAFVEPVGRRKALR